MRPLILLLSLTFFSCGQDNNKQRELDLKERELELREKELESKEKSSADSIGQNNSKKAQSVLSTNAKPQNIPIIKPLIITHGENSISFPIVELSDRSKSDEINLYIIERVKNMLGDDVNSANLKTKLSSSFDDGTYYEYKVKSTTSAKLLLQIVATTTGGAGMNIFTYDFNFDLISGSKKVKESYEFKHYEDYIGPPKN